MVSESTLCFTVNKCQRRGLAFINNVLYKRVRGHHTVDGLSLFSHLKKALRERVQVDTDKDRLRLLTSKWFNRYPRRVSVKTIRERLQDKDVYLFYYCRPLNHGVCFGHMSFAEVVKWIKLSLLQLKVVDTSAVIMRWWTERPKHMPLHLLNVPVVDGKWSGEPHLSDDKFPVFYPALTSLLFRDSVERLSTYEWAVMKRVFSEWEWERSHRTAISLRDLNVWLNTGFSFASNYTTTILYPFRKQWELETFPLFTLSTLLHNTSVPITTIRISFFDTNVIMLGTVFNENVGQLLLEASLQALFRKEVRRHITVQRQVVAALKFLNK